MSRTVLQIPMSPTLRKEAEKQALAQGFSSLQDAVRVFLSKLAQGVMRVTFDEEIRLSPRSEKRYSKIDEDFGQGKNIYKAKGVDDLMKQLREHSLS